MTTKSNTILTGVPALDEALSAGVVMVLTNPSAAEVGRPVFSRPFKSLKAAVRRAVKVGSPTIIYQPRNVMVDEDVWYVVQPVEKS